ncbi:hypothetical protein AKJ57_02305 [candidate division MSBL1 archaeon SCGC-AAA259A05]|uniref:Uncharacterized protein n=1 Tax=candidate division MSBL1 archaeon SCGC-AAA259A05 TaxID=1698259 RepID=A0A133UAD4_9EURY|nr:hypothetical protein AKJ57_02305 [candidate division MSBL1 archaeon SCGC-AAA259A05]
MDLAGFEGFYLLGTQEEEDVWLSRNSAANYFSYIKSFYGKFGCFVEVKTPSLDVANERSELKAADIRKLVDARPSLRCL